MTPNIKTKIKQTIHKLFEQPFARTGLDQCGRKQTYTCERSASLADWIMHALSLVAQQFRSFQLKSELLVTGSQARFHSIFSLWQTLVLFSRSFIPTSRGCLATFPMERTQKCRQVRHMRCLHRPFWGEWFSPSRSSNFSRNTGQLPLKGAGKKPKRPMCAVSVSLNGSTYGTIAHSPARRLACTSKASK